MTRIITSVAALGVIGTVALAGQTPPWAENEIGDGAIEFRLSNDEGAALILGCYPEGVVAGFEYRRSLDYSDRATVRSIPGEQLDVQVSHVSDRIVRVGGDGIGMTLGLIRSAARLYVRVSGESAFFNTAGSAQVVGRCLELQEEALRTARPGMAPGDAGGIGWGTGPDGRVPSPNQGPHPRLERQSRNNEDANPPP